MTDLRTPPVNDGDLFSQRALEHACEKPRGGLQVLEAGCGWGAGLALGDQDRQVTGVDLDLPELRDHTQDRSDLDSWHLGDLRTVPMPPRAYDVVHAPYLIERVAHAELVLDRFVAALRPGGLLLTRLRDRDTAFGFLDRMLPGGLAALTRSAERRTPLPAIYEKVASHRGMQWYCMMRGLVITEQYASAEMMSAVGGGLATGLCRSVATLSRGRLTAEHSEVSLVIRKPENRFARVI